MSIENWLGLCVLFGGMLLNAVYATWHVSNKGAALEVSLRDKIDNIYNLAVTKQEAQGEREAKARHDLANEVQRRISELILDDKALQARINDLATDMVRKIDLTQHEARMTAILERLDGKVDELRDRVAIVPRPAGLP